jgi:DNA-binding NarL/FixJ family response regulator
MDGSLATRHIRAADSDAQVVVLTSFGGRDQILGALDAGATGYLLKDATPDELVAGVRAAARHESPLAPKAARELLSARRTPQPLENLTAREREVLVLLAEGMANKLIARRLGIAEKTVKAHVTRILAALDVTDRTQAALWAQRHGLVASPH